MLGDSTGLSTEYGWRGSDYAQRWRAFVVNAAARMNLPVNNGGTFDELIDTFAAAIAERDAIAEQKAAEARAAAAKKQRLADWVENENANIAAQLNQLRNDLMAGIRAKYDSLLPFVQRGEIPATTANGQIKSMINDAKTTYSAQSKTLLADAQMRFEQEKAKS